MTDKASHNPRRIGLYPGTFDPITNGHLDVIARAARLLDKLVVGVAINTGKGPLFTLQERVELVTAEIESIASRNGMVIEVVPFDTLLIDFARKVGASMIVRGLRAGLPIRLVAALHDTSVAMIERHYSRWITEGLDELVARAVVPLLPIAA